MSLARRTYGRLEWRGDAIVLHALEPHVCIRLKQLFPRIPKAQGAPFTLAADMATAADVAWFLERYPLAANDEDLAALAMARDAFYQRQAEAERLLMADYTPPQVNGLLPGKSLRPHQTAAIEMLAMYGGLLVGDDVGEGKTFTAIGALLLPGALPATVVVDPHLQIQWAERIKDFTGLTTHCVTQTTPYPIPPCDVRIFRWTQLLGWADAWDVLGTGLVAMDECQELRTGLSSQRGQSADRLCKTARYRLGLTATPIYNYGSEIWDVMRFLRPEVLGARDDFMREWCADGGHIADAKALGTYLREQHAVMRKRKGAHRVNTVVQEVGHDAEHLASIEAVARHLAEVASTGTFQERGEAVRQLDLRVRMETGVAKAKYVADVVRVLVESGEPLILAGWHRDVYAIWLDRLSDLKPAMYTGSETPAKKRAEMDRFLSGDTDVFILSLRSGRGVDGLQKRAKLVVIGELDWSPEVHHQVIGRLDREGSVVDGTDEPITAIYLVADDGSDPPMMDVLGLKASDAAGIVDPDLGVRVQKSDAAPLQGLVQRYLKRGAS